MISAERDGEAAFGFLATPAGAVYAAVAVAVVAVATAASYPSGYPALAAAAAGGFLAVALYTGREAETYVGHALAGVLLGFAAASASAGYGASGGFGSPPQLATGALVVASAAFAPYLVGDVDLSGFAATSKSLNAATLAALLLAAVLVLVSGDVFDVVLMLLFLPSTLAWGLSNLFPSASVAVAAAGPAAALYSFGYLLRYASGVGLATTSEYRWAADAVDRYDTLLLMAVGVGVLYSVAATVSTYLVASAPMLAAAAWLPTSLVLAVLASTWLLNAVFAEEAARVHRTVAAYTCFVVATVSVLLGVILYPELFDATRRFTAADFGFSVLSSLLPLAVALLLLRAFTSVGVVGGPREWAGLGVTGLLATVMFAADDVGAATVFVGVAASVVAWDAVENSVGHAESGGWSWRPARAESLHLLASLAVAVAAVGVAAAGYLLLQRTPETPARPLAAVLAAFGVAAFVWTAVRTG